MSDATVVTVATLGSISGFLGGISGGIRPVRGDSGGIIGRRVSTRFSLVYGVFAIGGISGINCVYLSQTNYRPIPVLRPVRLDTGSHEEGEHFLNTAPQPTSRLRPGLIPLYIHAELRSHALQLAV